MTSDKKVHVVYIGAGTGLSTLLSGIKNNPRLKTSAVVTMSDSGGSSGDLRDNFGVLPPGDIFRCILALAPDEDQPTIRRIFNRRLALNHSPGNLFMFGAGQVYKSYQQAVDELCKTFSAAGRVYPVAVTPSDLCARFTDGMLARKEVQVDQLIAEGKVIDMMYLDPVIPANEEVLKLIGAADIICVGPGSFYTSVVPNFLYDGVREVIRASAAPIIFVSNLMTEGLGMKHLTAPMLTQALEHYMGRAADAIIMNSYIPPNLLDDYAQKEQKYPVSDAGTEYDPRYLKVPLWTDGSLARHDPAILAAVIWQTVDRLLHR